MRFYLEVPDDLISRIDALVAADKVSGREITRAAKFRELLRRGACETERKRKPKKEDDNGTKES